MDWMLPFINMTLDSVVGQYEGVWVYIVNIN